MLLDEQVEFMFAKLKNYFGLKESDRQFKLAKILPSPQRGEGQGEGRSPQTYNQKVKSYSSKPKTSNPQDKDIQLAKVFPSTPKGERERVRGNTPRQSQNISSTDPSYTYDLNGNRTQMTDPTGVTYYSYDALNRLISITNPNGKTITFSYDKLSRRTSMALPNGVVTTYSYDALSQLTSISHQLAKATLSYNYTYDSIGNRTSITDPSGTRNYTHDVIDRFISATHPLPDNPLESFKYDKVGNRVNAGSYVYDDANRLLQDAEFTYSYDNNGNMVSRTKKATGDVTTYTYNAENQLIRVDSPQGGFVTYRYDGLGRRIEKNVNSTITQYIYDNEDIILETDQDQNIFAHYTHGPGIDEPLIMERGGQSYCYHTDGLGSITTITNSSQNTINSYTYDSFGSIIQSTGSLINPYTYTGREYDPETDLYYYRSRHYDPYIGRFLQEDPIGFWGGVNFYTYCDNNPINWIDPLGLREGDKDKRWWKHIQDLLILPVYAEETGYYNSKDIQKELLKRHERLKYRLFGKIVSYYIVPGVPLITIGVIIIPGHPVVGFILIGGGVVIIGKGTEEFIDWARDYGKWIQDYYDFKYRELERRQ